VSKENSHEIDRIAGVQLCLVKKKGWNARKSDLSMARASRLVSLSRGGCTTATLGGGNGAGVGPGCSSRSDGPTREEGFFGCSRVPPESNRLPLLF